MRPRGENIEYDQLRDKFEAATKELHEALKSLALAQELLHVEQAKVIALRDSANDTGTKLRRLSVEIAQLKGAK